MTKLFKYARKEDCPDVAKHTVAPDGYVAWYEWSTEMAKAHVQERCSTCGFWSIWRPK